MQKKQQFNEYLLRLEEELKEKIQKEQDPLKEALRYARIGNYIDFSAVENVTVDDFMMLFTKRFGAERFEGMFLNESRIVF